MLNLPSKASSTHDSDSFYWNFVVKSLFKLLLQLDFNVDASWQIEFHQRVNRFIRWINDVHQTLVRADFQLITAGFVDVR